MKKVVRTVWIGLLSGLAFLGACCTSKSLSKTEKKQLERDRDSIQQILARREGAVVYGSPEVIGNYKLETLRLRSQLDSINYRLGEDVDLEKNARKIELQERLNSVRAELQRREGACVYGSPEIIQEYGRETERLRQEAEQIMQEIKELENSKDAKFKGDAEVLYGSPVPNRL